MLAKNLKTDGIVRILLAAFVVAAIILGVFLFKTLTKKPFDPNDPNLAFESIGFDLDKLAEYNMPIFINLGAEHCIGCIQMNGMLEELNKELYGKAIIKYVDLYKDENRKYYAEYHVRFLPTLLFFDKDGKPFVPKEDSPLKVQHFRDPETNEIKYTYFVGTVTKEQLLETLYEMGMEK